MLRNLLITRDSGGKLIQLGMQVCRIFETSIGSSSRENRDSVRSSGYGGRLTHEHLPGNTIPQPVRSFRRPWQGRLIPGGESGRSLSPDRQLV